ncbi:ABC transporter substrate-binding protein [Gracilibacillus lacisalsi]|uniref:ABC transporter substrate-binding protein n=1 Tax=Gracilibacillus lacisalsi TaxID=393087 RepID=UPI00036220EA|nr:sugar ABC transporter substrate-binding protein [Gracilibacillus lacisalsi]
MKGKANKFVNPFVVIIFVVLLLSACSSDSSSSSSNNSGSSEEGELTMTAWGNPAEIKVYQKAIDAYQEVNPDVSIKLIPGPGDTYKQKLLTQLQGSQSPDLFYVGGEYMSQLIETGRVAELSEFLGSEESYVKPDEFADGLWGAAKKGEEIYGAPVDSNPVLLYYNKKVLEEAGLDPNEPQKLYEAGEWNWDNFVKVNKQVAESGKYGYVAESGYLHMFNWVWSNGGQMYDEEGNIMLQDNEKAEEAIAYLNENVTNGNFKYAGSLPEGQGPDAMFMSNQTAFVGAGRWYTPMFRENESLEFDYIPWPTNTGNKLEPVTIGTAYLSATTDSDNLEEAKKFLSFYTSEEGQRARLEGNGNAVPSISSVDDIIEGAEVPEHASYLIDTRDIGKVETHQSIIPGLESEVTSIFDLMFLGENTPEAAIAEITEKAETMIQDYRNQ